METRPAAIELTQTVTLVHRYGGNTMVVDLSDYLSHRRSRFADWHLSDDSAPDALKPAPTSVDRPAGENGAALRAVDVPRPPRAERRRRRRLKGGSR